MFSFFKKKEKANYNFLSVDMHSHLIPGIDDGAKTLEDSIAMLKALSQLGFKKVVTTPHVMSEYYPNTPAIIKAGLDKLKIGMKNSDLKIEVEVAAEYYIDDVFEQLITLDDSLLSFSDKYVLIEMSTLTAASNLFSVIFQLKTKGFQPILAHPERYIYYADQLDKFEKAKSMGCHLQVNLLSLSGYYGSAQKKLAIALLKAGLVDFLGTDLHRMSQVKYLEKAMDDRNIRKLLRNSSFKNSNL